MISSPPSRRRANPRAYARLLSLPLAFLLLLGSLSAAPRQEPNHSDVVVGRTKVSEVTFGRLVQYLWDNRLMDNELEKESLRRAFLNQIEVIALGDILNHIAVQENHLSDAYGKALLEGEVRGQLERMAIAELGILGPGEELRYESEEATRALQERIDEFRLPNRATWRHIYIRSASHSSPEEAVETLNEIQQEIRNGTPFPQLVATYSDEPDASEDQLFGPIEYEGKVLPQMAKVLDTLEVGAISEPLTLPMGFMIIQLIDREEDRLWANEEKRRLRVVLDLRADQKARKIDRILEENRSLFPPKIPRNPSPELPDHTPYLTIGNETITLGQLRLLARTFPAGFQELARVDPWNPQLLGPMERQFLLLNIYSEKGPLPPGEYERLRDQLRHNLIAARVMALLEVEHASTPDEKEIRARYETIEAGKARTLVDFEIIQIPTLLLIDIAGSNSGHDLMQAAGRLAQLWQKSALPAGDFVQEAFQNPTDIPVEAHAAYPLERLKERYPENVSAAPDGIPTVYKFPNNWAIVRLSNQRSGIPPFETVRNDILRELTAEQHTALREEIKASLLAQYDFEVLIGTEDFRWDTQANNLALQSSDASP